jgi:hypothetical protein
MRLPTKMAYRRPHRLRVGLVRSSEYRIQVVPRRAKPRKLVVFVVVTPRLC